MSSFEAFKDANNERLGEIEKRMSADTVTTDKVSRALDEQKRALDTLALKKARPVLGREARSGFVDIEHKQAFETYVRSGDDQDERTTNMTETKPWYLSRTIWASLITVATALAGILGLPVEGLDNSALTDTLLQALAAIAGLVAIFGRLSAKNHIG